MLILTLLMPFQMLLKLCFMQWVTADAAMLCCSQVQNWQLLVCIIFSQEQIIQISPTLVSQGVRAIPQHSPSHVFLAVQDSSISDLVSQSVSQ